MGLATTSQLEGPFVVINCLFLFISSVLLSFLLVASPLPAAPHVLLLPLPLLSSSLLSAGEEQMNVFDL